MSANAPTRAQLAALLWLRNRNGDGVFDRNQVLVAAGQKAPVMRGTWSRLESFGLVERYYQNRRLRLTDHGQSIALYGVQESQPQFAEDDA